MQGLIADTKKVFIHVEKDMVKFVKTIFRLALVFGAVVWNII